MPDNVEVLLISAVLRTGDHLSAAGRGITTKFFHTYPDEWKFIEAYISIHKRTPSKDAFKSKFSEFRIKASDDIEYFIEEVRKSHIQHELTNHIQDAIALMQNGETERAVKALHSGSLAIEAEMGGMSGDEDIFQNWQPIYDEAMLRNNRFLNQGQAGIPTGFPTLDERTGGPQPGQVWIVAARLGQGKTWSLVRMATAAAFSGYVVQYDALEQSRIEIGMRVHAFASSEYGKQVFKNLDLSQGKNFSPREYKEFLNDLKGQVSGKFHIADATGGTIGPAQIAAQIERNTPDAVFLDYITLVDTPSGTSDWQGIAGLSKTLKQIAGRYKVPIIAAAQLNRNAAGRKEIGGPEDLAESDALGRDADAVIQMRQLSKSVIMMKLTKFRHGADGFSWYTLFKPNTGHFEEVTRDEAFDKVAEDKAEDEEGDTYTFKPRSKGSFAKTQQDRKPADDEFEDVAPAPSRVVVRRSK